ncbi:hypothetical protein AAF712_010062 [Marasmius tenuissimus]|uniref:Cyclic nucleotide-binding domain-containing protein n=1 Tax=Marasmius tenuissimus TaxID=585030 RepID=A0ABR2ZNN9_9AGAR
MAQTQNFGDTISGGIQDIAALLPLLGTEQCERHVGEALQKGYLYAAATPLSVFGSLGVVKTSFATFLATTTKPFYGGSWLHDAGFATTGSVASMVTLAPGTKRYGAEIQLERLMKEQHIDNPEMISSVEWFGWKKADEVGTGSLHPNPSWNLCLILTSALASTIALVPYLYLALQNQSNALAWLFPSLRSFGSFLCVVSIQLTLQLRIHHITSSSLLLMKERHRYPLSREESIQDQDMLLESRLMKLVDESKQRASDLEKGQTPKKQGPKVTAPVSADLTLVILHIMLVVGMGMIVAGYVGCFNLVSQTRAKYGPYVWFGLEAILSIARVILWGSNPSWDEQNTGVMLRLELLPKSKSVPPLDQDQVGFGLDVGSDSKLDNTNIPTVQMFPIVTSPRPLHLLNETGLGLHMGEDMEWRKSFVAHSLEDFLATATPYVGPLGRIEIDGFSLYYAVIAEVSHEYMQKLLCATVVPNTAGWDSLSFLISGETAQHSAFLSHSRPLAATHALEVAFHQKLDDTSQIGLEHKAVSRIIEYSNRLFHQLVAQNTTPHLHLSWSLTETSPMIPSIPAGTRVPVSYLDELYLRIGQLCDFKGENCLKKGNIEIYKFFTKVPSGEQGQLFGEYALLFDSAIQETYLCIMEHRFVRRAAVSDRISHSLALQWIQKMETRLSAQKAHSIARVPTGSTLVELSTMWDSVSSDLRSLRLLPVHSPVLQSWERQFHNIIDRCSVIPTREQFELQLFTSKALQRILSQFFFPYIKDGDWLFRYKEFTNLVRSSLQYLHSAKPLPCFDRLKPWGSGLPEFAPPYTFLDSAPADDNTGDFLAQIRSIQVLGVWNTDTISWAYETLFSHHSLPLSLTTIIHKNFQPSKVWVNEIALLLGKHKSITFFLYDQCDPSHLGTEAGDAERQLGKAEKALQSNRMEWWANASKQGRLRYRVGLETIPTSPEAEKPSLSILPIGPDLLLPQHVRVTALIHVPVHGRILPILSAKSHGPPDPRLSFTARLVQVPPGSYSSYNGTYYPSEKKPTEICSREKPIEQPKGIVNDIVVTRFDDFPCIPPGCYEVHISHLHHDRYVFRSLKIDFAPRTIGPPLRVQRGFLRIHPDADPGLDATERAAGENISAVPSGPSQLSEVAKAEVVLDSLETYFTASDEPQSASDISKIYDLITQENTPPLVFRFQFSLESPDGRYHGGFSFSPETTQHTKLKTLVMALSPLTGQLRVDRSWVEPNPSGAVDDVVDPIASWSEVHCSIERPGSGVQKEQLQSPEGALETVESPDQSEATETQAELPLDFTSPPDYRFHFSLQSPEGCQEGSFIISRPTVRHYQMTDLTMTLSPIIQKLRLDHHWLDPLSGHDPSAAEEGLAEEHMFAAWNKINSLGEQEPQDPAEMPSKVVKSPVSKRRTMHRRMTSE